MYMDHRGALMNELVFIAIHIVKPLLIAITILSTVIAITIISKEITTMKLTTRQVRALINMYGKKATREILKKEGLTLKDFGIR